MSGGQRSPAGIIRCFAGEACIVLFEGDGGLL